MKTFKDTNGKDWAITMNVLAISRLRNSALKMDLIDITRGKLIPDIEEDPIKLMEIIFEILRPAAEAAGVTQDQFFTACNGAVVEAAIAAFFDELIDFFPSDIRKSLREQLEWFKAEAAKLHAQSIEALKNPPTESAEIAAPETTGIN